MPPTISLCTIEQFLLKWLLISNLRSNSAADITKLYLEYGLEDSKLFQHSITSKRQFELYSQNKETIIVLDSSSDESTLPDAQGNLRTIPIQIDAV